MNIIRVLLILLWLGVSSFTHADLGANFCGDARLNATHIMQNLQNNVDVEIYVKGFKNKYMHPNNAEYYSDTMYLYNLKTISKAWTNYVPYGSNAEKFETVKQFSNEIYQECMSP